MGTEATRAVSTDTQFTVAAHFVRLLTDYCEHRGLPGQDLLTNHGLPAGALSDPNNRLPFLTFDRMLISAAARLDDPHLGLHLGQAARIGHLGISGLLQSACKNGWEVLPILKRYCSLTMTAFRDEIVIGTDEATLYWRSTMPANIEVSHHQAELDFSHTVTLATLLTGAEARPQHVSFKHAPASDTHVVEAFFQCPVTWHAEVDSLRFATALLDHPINPGADTASQKALEALCAQQLNDIQRNEDPEWLMATRTAIANALPQGPVLIRDIAPHTGKSTRQLQKLLSDRGLSFRALVDTIRSELAERYLKNTDLSLVEIAIRLGFSEQSAFQRAYRRWSNKPPGQARRTHR